MKPKFSRVFAFACALSIFSLQTACSQQSFFGLNSQSKKERIRKNSSSPVSFDQLSHREQIKIVDAQLDRELDDIVEETIDLIESSEEPIELEGVVIDVTADDLRRMIESLPGGSLEGLTLREATDATADDVLDFGATTKDYTEFAEDTNELIGVILSGLMADEFELTGLKLQESGWCDDMKKSQEVARRSYDVSRTLGAGSAYLMGVAAPAAKWSCGAAAAEDGLNPLADAGCAVSGVGVGIAVVGGVGSALTGLVGWGEDVRSKIDNYMGSCDKPSPQPATQPMPAASLRLSSQR